MIAIAEIKETGRRETPYLGSSLLHHRSDWCRVILRQRRAALVLSLPLPRSY